MMGNCHAYNQALDQFVLVLRDAGSWKIYPAKMAGYILLIFAGAQNSLPRLKMVFSISEGGQYASYRRHV